MAWIQQLGEASVTALGFFWKAAWAFALGYLISAMIQVFVPRKALAKKMGKPTPKSVALATGFGTVSSSCSFAALSAARALVGKGAHFVCAVAFMFASTNLVLELGILIVLFLGWTYLAAELVGGLVLISISTLLLKWVCPPSWLDAAREKVTQNSEDEEDKKPWQQAIRTRAAWQNVGKKFVMEWQMVWQEVLIGFTIAGFMASFVPDSFWKALFLADMAANDPTNFWVALENAAVAPLVAACTFIGSMGNIPLATVLNSGGVLFAGIIGFIYSDLMVPPLVKINAKYYGWKLALTLASVMYASIVTTALLMHFVFAWTGWTPESNKAVHDVAQFKIDHTLFFNGLAVALFAGMWWLSRQSKSHGDQHGHAHHENDKDTHGQAHESGQQKHPAYNEHQEHAGHQANGGHQHHHSGKFQTTIAWLCVGLLAAGLVCHLVA